MTWEPSIESSAESNIAALAGSDMELSPLCIGALDGKGRAYRNEAWPPGCHSRWLCDLLETSSLDNSFWCLLFVWILSTSRRKFRSQTSDNMDRWKSRGGKSQRGEAKKWEDQRRERVRRKKMQVRQKVGKSRFIVFFQWFVALGGRKVGSLKRRVRSHLPRWEMKIARRCGQSTFPSQNDSKWFQMHKAHHSQTTFGSWDVKKVHAVAARSTFPSQNAQSTTCSDHFWKLRCRESARRCGKKNISKSKCTKHYMFGPLLEVEMSKRCTGAKHISKSKV